MGWVEGKPKLVSERCLGTAAEVEALLDARERAMVPERTRHLDFGAVAAAWGLLAGLGIAGIIDEACGGKPPGLPLSPGTYLALAALNRVVDPCSKRGFAEWWRTTAADRFTKIPAAALDHRRFWDAMHAVPLRALPRIEEKLALAACARFGLDTSSVALDMTNFATFIDTGNGKAPVAQRGKAKQKRSDLRLAGLEEEIFGRHVLITDHDDWPAAEVIAGYRSQSEAEFSFRQMKDPRAVSFSPMFHWTEHNIRIHVFTCVLALQTAHLMRLQAERAGLRMSVRELLNQLAGIGETVLIYPAERGRPKARRMLTETTATQDKLIETFQLDRYAPAVRS